MITMNVYRGALLWAAWLIETTNCQHTATYAAWIDWKDANLRHTVEAARNMGYSMYHLAGELP